MYCLNEKLDDTLKIIGFVKRKNDQGVYCLNYTKRKVIVRLYMDDLIITGASQSERVEDVNDEDF